MLLSSASRWATSFLAVRSSATRDSARSVSLSLGALDGVHHVSIAAGDALHHRKLAHELAEVVGGQDGVERRDVVVFVESDGAHGERGARHVQLAYGEPLKAPVVADLSAHRGE